LTANISEIHFPIKLKINSLTQNFDSLMIILCTTKTLINEQEVLIICCFIFGFLPGSNFMMALFDISTSVLTSCQLISQNREHLRVNLTFVNYKELFLVVLII
jgi:hypothetical protein